MIHLRTHSAYSLLEGALKVPQIIDLCQKHKMPAAAITDTANMFGAMEFSQYAMKGGVQPILGCQMPVASIIPERFDTDQLVLLAQNETGYQNLMKLVSRAWLQGADGIAQIPLSEFDGLSDGLIVLSGGMHGGVGRLLAGGHKDKAVELLGDLDKLFHDRLYIEIQRHGLEEEETIEDALLDLAYDKNLPLVATNECFFTDESVFTAHDALLCVAEGRYVIEEDRRKVTQEHYFKSPQQMRELFADLPEAIDNTQVIAKRCSYLLKPIKPLLPAFGTQEGRSETDEFKAQAREGLEKKLQAHVYKDGMNEAEKQEAAKPYRERLEYELDVISEMKFPGYFLIVSDFIKWAKENNIPVGPGRGSGAASVVAWSLLITDLDPLHFSLVFERFLNPERVSMPDFDIDFCQERRDEVIRYVQDKYGHDMVAQIITFGKLQAKAVIRDVGRVLQMPYGQVDKISKLIPNNPANPPTLDEALEAEPQLRELQRDDPTVKRLIDISRKLEGLYRHASTHAAGVVIGDRPLDQLVPLYRDPKSDMPVTQFNMKFVEQAGLVKFDFLGLKTLTVLQKCVDILQKRGIDIDLSTLPLDDTKTFEMLGRAETVAVFQLESSGMQDLMTKAKPDCLEDIIALVALYRPGPMENIPKYLSVKNGTEEPDYMHPLLKPILEETYGIMIYQEQVMQAAQILAGYSLGGADLLRRAMGKKIKAEMDAQREMFTQGAKKQDVPAEQSSRIFDQIAKFAGYGFNKAHSACYAVVAYQTAYLKANYPVAFMAATMTLDMGNTDKLAIFRRELGRLGVELLVPDVNESMVEFLVDTPRGPDDTGGAIRYALGAIKGAGTAAMQTVVRERMENGPYTDIYDFLRRADPFVLNKKQMESLTCAGAFDSIYPNRAELFENLPLLLRYAQNLRDDRISGQESLFGGGGGDASEDLPAINEVMDWDPLEKLGFEAKAIGFCLSAHPLDSYEKPIERLGAVPFGEVEARIETYAGQRVTLAGVLTSKRERVSKSGNKYAFVGLSDTSGEYEATLFSETLMNIRDKLESGALFLLQADVQREEERLRLTCTRIEPLEDAISRVSGGLEIELVGDECFTDLHDLITNAKDGRTSVRFTIPFDAENAAIIKIPRQIDLTPKEKSRLMGLKGVENVQEL